MTDDGDRLGTAAGAVLIVDVEGSTRLSARLQSHGTIGAESLADILGLVYAPIVDHVAANEGFVAEFAGDGVLAVFLGDESVAVPRAIAAAGGIMAGLSNMGELDTPDGPAQLSVRAVVGSGAVDWRIWVTESEMAQRATYSFLGSAVVEAQVAEAQTPGGVLAAGPNATGHLPRDAATRPISEGLVAIEVPPKANGVSPPSRPPRQPDPAVAFYPSALLEADVGGEFRDVVSVFVEFRDVPSLDDDSPMVKLLDLLGEHRGFLCNSMSPGPDSRGVRVLALWGAPTSRERDIGYALRFLADLKLAVGDDAVRAGVTRGAVYAGFVGTERQDSYTGIGSSVNLAARMCTSASWGEIRVNEAIYARLEDPWILTELGRLDYRGFADPVATYSVVHVPPVRRADPFKGAFVGRAEELDELEDLLAPLWLGRSAGVIAVSGDAGIGKSRLIDQLRARLDARTPRPNWLEARADEIRSQPFATLRDALTGYFGRPSDGDSQNRLVAYVEGLEEVAPEMSAGLERSRDTLMALLEPGDDPQAYDSLDPKNRFENLVVAVEDLVAALEHTGPVIVVLADGHWVDQGTADVLTRMQRGLADSRVALVVETRDVDSGVLADHTVNVPPLDASGIQELAEQILDQPPSADLVEFVQDRSDGNTFYARQLLEYVEREALTDGGHSPSTEEAEGLVPTDLRRLLVARLDSLSPAVRRLVQVGSVLGREVDVRVLRRMIDNQGELAAQIGEAITARIWETIDTDRVAFTSLLVRDAAYGMVVHADARRLHEAAAAAIQDIVGSTENLAAEIAFHFDKAGESGLAAPHYLAAGTAAAAQYANSEAIEYFTRASELFGDANPTGVFEAVRSIFMVHDVLGDREAQEADLAQMESIPDIEPAMEFEVSILRARLLAALGSYSEAEAAVRAAESESEAELDAGTRGSVEFLVAQLARYQGRADDAQKRGEQARTSFSAAGLRGRVATVDDFLGGIAWDRGDFDAAAQLHRSAASRFGEVNDATNEIRALNNLGSVLFAQGDYSAARKIHEEGATRSAEIGYRLGEGDHLDNTGGTAWAVGDYALALDRYSAALAIRERMRDAWGVAISKGNLGATQRALGQAAEGLALYREALEIDRRIGRRRGEAFDLHGMGLCYLDLGRNNLASESLAEAAGIRESLGEAHLANESHAACAVAMARRGDVAEAVELIETMLEAEGPSLFDGAVETTATLLRCVEVLEHVSADRAAQLRSVAADRVTARAERIGDPIQRNLYVSSVSAHREALNS